MTSADGETILLPQKGGTIFHPLFLHTGKLIKGGFVVYADLFVLFFARRYGIILVYSKHSYQLQNETK
jgi:hypothetical protein